MTERPTRRTSTKSAASKAAGSKSAGRKAAGSKGTGAKAGGKAAGSKAAGNGAVDTGGPSTPRSNKGAQTRARLLTAATSVFEDVGFLDARISDIAEAAGLSHGSFYHYFDSKEQIFREVAEAQEALLTAPAPKDDADADDALSDYERIRRANHRYLERYRDNGKIMGVIEEVSRYDDHVNEARLQRQKHFAGRSEASLRRLQADGKASPDVDPEIAALALGSMVARVAELWLIEHWGDYELDEIADQVTLLWANAIGLERE